jgi:putative cell wall-binding protein
MIKKSVAGGIILLFLLSLIIPMVSSIESQTSDTIYVDDDGGADYTKIPGCCFD